MLKLEISTKMQAKGGGDFCGDQIGVWDVGDLTILCLVDGLGSGEPAEIAARAALDFVGRNLDLSLKEIVSSCNRAIRHTRGVAIALSAIDRATGHMNYAAVGNIHGMLLGDERRLLVANSGVVGDTYKSLLLENIQISPGKLIMLYSDGIKQLVDMKRYGDLKRVDLTDLATRIMGEWRIEMDDAAIILCRVSA